jgi:hypothetical protein
MRRYNQHIKYHTYYKIVGQQDAKHFNIFFYHFNLNLKKYSFRAAIKFYQRALDFLDKLKQ